MLRYTYLKIQLTIPIFFKLQNIFYRYINNNEIIVKIHTQYKKNATITLELIFQIKNYCFVEYV